MSRASFDKVLAHFVEVKQINTPTLEAGDFTVSSKTPNMSATVPKQPPNFTHVEIIFYTFHLYYVHKIFSTS